MSTPPLSPEQDIIYSIIEQWGNGACSMEIMEGWLKDLLQSMAASLCGYMGYREEGSIDKWWQIYKEDNNIS